MVRRVELLGLLVLRDGFVGVALALILSASLARLTASMLLRLHAAASISKSEGQSSSFACAAVYTFPTKG